MQTFEILFESERHDKYKADCQEDADAWIEAVRRKQGSPDTPSATTPVEYH